MLFSLALIPSIVLLIYIYKKDKREKEPLRLLIKCFVWGIIIILPVMLIELFLEGIFEGAFIQGSVGYAIVDGFIVAAFSEELFKYLALKHKTWKSKEFNCTFDGIVYSVFVSLGFATLENILYVFESDISTAITRMFTAVPGHAYDAVFMGYFYSKAKQAEIDGNKKLMKSYKKKALLIPVILHGIYDALISVEEEAVGEGIVYTGIFLWILFIIFEFVMSIKIVNKASQNDRPFVEYNENEVLGAYEGADSIVE